MTLKTETTVGNYAGSVYGVTNVEPVCMLTETTFQRAGGSMDIIILFNLTAKISGIHSSFEQFSPHVLF